MSRLHEQAGSEHGGSGLEGQHPHSGEADGGGHEHGQQFTSTTILVTAGVPGTGGSVVVGRAAVVIVNGGSASDKIGIRSVGVVVSDIYDI